MLVSFLKSREITQKDFAEQIGVTPGYLSALLSGKKTPSLTVAVQIEQVTGGDVPAWSWIDHRPIEQGGAA